ncbi:nuclear transport factor 2 family protein [Solitalea longa]|uniref:Nuclear transport factor 2 family protein n=1 Tax=Solitalea longa TaxID=2079460 RepID=A0A2S5A8I3_9SPHI|nr:nuclear transport factor 2 family protein [Solitalea longa]POY38413.1 nuclear transport factor 2 family protein [Solitalea longa]
MKTRILILFVLFAWTSKGQTSTAYPSDEKQLYKVLFALDSSLFATAYTCQPEITEKFFTDDMEFYHDKGGITISKAAFIANLKKNFCDPNREVGLKRVLVPGTMKVYPMGNYGAVQNGEHYFYEVYKDGTEKRVGIAKFTHLWMFKDGVWRISRVISYDHQPASN